MCAIYDDEGDLIRNSDVAFIYLPNGSLNFNNFEFKEKSDINAFLTNLISENQRLFISIEKIRNDMFGLLTDRGIYEFKKIICRGIRSSMEMKLSNLDVTSLISMFELETSNLTESEMYMIIYNVLLYTSRYNACIVYVDFVVDEVVMDWLNNLGDNVQVLINAEKIDGSIYDVQNFIKLGRKNEVERYELSLSKLRTLIYLNHPIVIRNLDLQTKENLLFYKSFSDEDITYLVKFTSDNCQIPF